MSATTVNIDTAQPFAQQDKDAGLRYSFDLSALLPAGDPLAGVAWSVTGGGMNVDASAFQASSCTVDLSGGTVGKWYAIVGSWITVGGIHDQIVFRMFIKSDAESDPVLGTALFPNKFTAIRRLRTDRLMVAAKALPRVELSDDYLWDKLRAAEAQTARELRVFFAPTTMFPNTPTDVEVTALAGAPWAIDPGYDFGPEFFAGNSWGYIKTRQKPIISVSSIKLIYPAPAAVEYTFPAEWVRLDRQYGQIQLVPSSNLTLAAQGGQILQFVFNRTLPFSLQVRYVAGLENPTRDYPDLIDLVLKRTTLNVLHDSFRPQSGSISADGLSQSVSIDMEKYEEKIDLIINGPKGSNGGLMAAIHGVRMAVM